MTMRGEDRLLPSTVHLATARFGRRMYYYPETGSTNDVAIDLAGRGEVDGTVVLTDFQRHGRGRRGHTWFSPAGEDLLFSLILRPGGESRSVLPVTLCLSLAISVLLSRETDATVGVKWPNDVVTATGKLAGILAEASHAGGAANHVVAGVGVNVNTTAFPDGLGPAASCRTLAGHRFNRAALFADLLGIMETYYDRFRADGFGPLVSAFNERLLGRGGRVRVVDGGAPGEGTVRGVDARGGLEIETDTGIRVLHGETVEELS
jgi:BirA family biotin operon repressor/biotin-[acetyl-CoA-carboxylase] ligase